MADDAPRTRLIRIPPFNYLHVLDRNTNVTRLEVGPQTFVCREHERVVFGPEKMIIVPPRHYCIITNPVIRQNVEIDYSSIRKKLVKGEENASDDILDIIKSLESNKGQPELDRFGQAKLRHADREMRFEQNEPFPLYPGEQLLGSMIPLQVVKPNSALRLKSTRDFTDRYASISQGKIIPRKAGDEWLFEGPATYFPQVEIDVIETVNAVIVKPGHALKLRAKSTMVDRNGVIRKTGEQWLMRAEGAYLPGVHETVIHSVEPIVLTEMKTLHLSAKRSFTDVFGVERMAGDEWLVTYKDKETHIPDVNETVVKEVASTFLEAGQYCVINNPVDQSGQPQYGMQKLVRGEANFFLQPGEFLDSRGIQNVYVLGEEEALYVTCNEGFEDKLKNGTTVKRVPGQRWMVYGPLEYLPPLQVTVLSQRKALVQVESLNFYAFFV